MALQYIKTVTGIGAPGDSPHEIYTDDLFKRDGVMLHRYTNVGGFERSAIFRDGVEVYNVDRCREQDMICAYRRQLYLYKFGAKNALM